MKNLHSLVSVLFVFGLTACGWQEPADVVNNTGGYYGKNKQARDKNGSTYQDNEAFREFARAPTHQAVGVSGVEVKDVAVSENKAPVKSQVPIQQEAVKPVLASKPVESQSGGPGWQSGYEKKEGIPFQVKKADGRAVENMPANNTQAPVTPQDKQVQNVVLPDQRPQQSMQNEPQNSGKNPLRDQLTREWEETDDTGSYGSYGGDKRDAGSNGNFNAKKSDRLEPLEVAKEERKSLPSSLEEPAAASNNKSAALIWPVNGGKVISAFGSKKSGVSNDGVNISIPAGTEVKAAGDGEVIYTGSELRGYGNLVILRHSEGWLTSYAHNQKLLVANRQKVKQGETIAISGGTGDVSQPQLHFSIRKGKEAVDPESVLGRL